MTDEPRRLFTPISDEELRENGYDPDWIFSLGEDEEGPFRVYRDNRGVCGHCGGTTPSFMVVNLATGTGGSTEWHGDAGEIEVQETVGMLNAAWLAGYRSPHPCDPAAIRIDAGQIADRAEQLADALPDHIDVDFAVGDDFAEVVVNTTGRALIRDALCALAALGGGG